MTVAVWKALSLGPGNRDRRDVQNRLSTWNMSVLFTLWLNLDQKIQCKRDFLIQPLMGFLMVPNHLVKTLRGCLPGSGGSMTSVDQKCPRRAMENHRMSSSGRGFPPSGLNGLPPPRPTQAKLIQSRRKLILLGATWKLYYFIVKKKNKNSNMILMRYSNSMQYLPPNT